MKLANSAKMVFDIPLDPCHHKLLQWPALRYKILLWQVCRSLLIEIMLSVT